MLTISGEKNNMQSTLQATTGLSYGSGFAGFIAGLSFNDWIAIVGVIFMFLTYGTNLYFKRRDDARLQKVADLKARAYEQGLKPR